MGARFQGTFGGVEPIVPIRDLWDSRQDSAQDDYEFVIQLIFVFFGVDHFEVGILDLFSIIAFLFGHLGSSCLV